MDLESSTSEEVLQSRVKKLTASIKSALANLAKWWTTTARPAIAKALTAIAHFYKTKIHPILAMKTSPEKRAIAAGRYLCRLALTYGILSIIGAIIMALIKRESDVCLYRFSFDDSCSEYAMERPYLTWAIVSLLISLIVASFLFAFGSYVEAKMNKQLREN